MGTPTQKRGSFRQRLSASLFDKSDWLVSFVYFVCFFLGWVVLYWLGLSKKPPPLLLEAWPYLKLILYALGAYLVADILLTVWLVRRHMRHERRLQSIAAGALTMPQAQRTTADRIHLFAHRIGLVLSALPFLFVTLMLIGNRHTLSLSVGDLLAVAVLFLCVLPFYLLPRLIGWIVAALFE